MMPAAAMSEAHGLEIEAGDACSNVQSGLALNADRLQRIGVARSADEEIATAADADRRVGADAAIAAGELAIAEPRGRRGDRPGELRLRSNAYIDADAPHRRHVGLGAAARALEHAFEICDGSHDKADILSAAAFEDAGAGARHRISAGDRACESGGGDEEGGKSHDLFSAIEKRRDRKEAPCPKQGASENCRQNIKTIMWLVI